jgi:hypothetical protein
VKRACATGRAVNRERGTLPPRQRGFKRSLQLLRFAPRVAGSTRLRSKSSRSYFAAEGNARALG